jgi:drug/metabolite transporter (DMT)-like permease
MRLRYWLLLIVAALGWGIGGVITRAAFDQGVDPVEFSAYRSAVAVIAMLGYLLAAHRPIPTDREAWRAGMVIGTVNLAAPFLLLTLAVVYASAGFVGLLVANLPIATALWAHFLGDERLKGATILGLSVSFAGMLLLLASGDSGLDEGGNAALAIGLTLLGLAMASYGILYAKRALASIDSFRLALPQFAIGSALLIALLPFTDGLPAEVTANGWLLIISAGVLSTALPFLAFYRAMKHVTATQAALTGYLIPIVAIVLGALLLDERVTPAMLAGGALILAGVVLTDRAASGRAAPLTTDPPGVTSPP